MKNFNTFDEPKKKKMIFDLMFFGCQTLTAPQAIEILVAISEGKVYGIEISGKSVTVDVTVTPHQLGIKKGTHVEPEGGWKPSTNYVVEAAYNSHNPIHKYIFYSGYLCDKGFPGSYSGILSADGEKASIKSLYYLKAIKEIDM
jgi:hypothetical protein